VINYTNHIPITQYHTNSVYSRSAISICNSKVRSRFGVNHTSNVVGMTVKLKLHKAKLSAILT